MPFQPNKKKIPTKHVRLSDEGEKKRVLMIYAGIFPNNIKEYADKIIKRQRIQKNFSR